MKRPHPQVRTLFLIILSHKETCWLSSKKGPIWNNFLIVFQVRYFNNLIIALLDDGHYPRIKAYSEYEKDDLHKLITLGKWEEVTKVIDSIDITTTTGQ